MILTTTHSIEGFQIEDYLGIVTGVAINQNKQSIGFSMSKYFNLISDNINVVKEDAFQKLKTNATQLKANAVIGITVDIEMTTHNYAIVSITGTAVKVKL